MTIYLDTNALYNWLDLAALDRVALSIVAADSQQQVIVPSIAAEEAESHFVRRLQRAANQIRLGQKIFNELFHEPLLKENLPDIGKIVGDWRIGLTRHASTIEPPEGALEEAIRREIWRLPPARAIGGTKGEDAGATGARDCVIWLTVVDHHRRAGDDGHFISADRDFTFKSGQFKPELLADLNGIDRPLHSYPSVFEFLKKSGQLVGAADFDLTLEELQERAEPIVRRILPLVSVVAEAAFASVDDRYVYETVIDEAQAMRIRSGRRYDTANGHLFVVDSIWKLRADCYRTEATGTLESPVDAVEDAWFEGGIQLYLPTEEGEERLAQLMSGRMQRSDPA
ncbi:MAG TPA: PIN domain-containing protein [Gaiellaceae bacterium]|nr:PIN domain-containing protein [Gaiellaceae bacterium]